MNCLEFYIANGSNIFICTWSGDKPDYVNAYQTSKNSKSRYIFQSGSGSNMGFIISQNVKQISSLVMQEKGRHTDKIRVLKIKTGVMEDL